MGSHGKSALKAALIGSVTIGVIHKDTRVPVLVVRRGGIIAGYGKRSKEPVKGTIRKMKKHKLKSGRSGRTVPNPRQAIAISLSESRKKEAKVPSPLKNRTKARKTEKK